MSCGSVYVFLINARESYGEDIADTDSQNLDYSDEDEYEDSFINDDEPELFPPSPISCGGGMAISYLV